MADGELAGRVGLRLGDRHGQLVVVDHRVAAGEDLALRDRLLAGVRGRVGRGVGGLLVLGVLRGHALHGLVDLVDGLVDGEDGHDAHRDARGDGDAAEDGAGERDALVGGLGALGAAEAHQAEDQGQQAQEAAEPEEQRDDRDDQADDAEHQTGGAETVARLRLGHEALRSARVGRSNCDCVG
ncbi:hypothetical protein ACFQ60_21730 [Streptomyces zhihengii]